MVCLQILQSCRGYINTLTIQATLAEPDWADVLTDVDRRGLTTLFHINMTLTAPSYCDPDRRRDLSAPPTPDRLADDQ